MSDNLLNASDLNAWYGRAHILFDVGIQVHPGEVVAVMGRNGAGKSTLFKAIMGLLTRCRGAIHFRGKAISNTEPFRISRQGLGFVPEDRRIFTDLTVLENLAVARQAPREGTHTWTIEELFDVFPNLGRMKNRPGGHMSGGEQQMLTIARTLMGNPYLVLLDEPSEGVAPVIVEQMADMIVTMKKHGVSILLSEQNVHFAEWVSDRAYVLEKGRICYQGSITELAGNEEVRRAYLTV